VVSKIQTVESSTTVILFNKYITRKKEQKKKGKEEERENTEHEDRFYQHINHHPIWSLFEL
jgi:hypothetical protein